jgi:Fe-S-cluster-containing hydrogenase component 2
MRDNKPAVKNENCVACGHCTAVCPNEAIDNRLSPLEKQPGINDTLKITEKQAAYFMRSRRSIRWFHDRPVAKEDLEDMLNMGRYAMSGANSQGVSYLVT